jgi:hypothetical protein
MTEIQNREMATLFAAIEKINHRLDKIEGEHGRPTFTPPMHASQEKFSIAEAIADAIFDGTSKEKACTFEPNDKPCDHCSMCSSRGF